MSKIYERIEHYLTQLKKDLIRGITPIEKISFKECDYHVGKLPTVENWLSFDNQAGWGGKGDSHAWFSFEIPNLFDLDNCDNYLEVNTNLDGWDASNPQFLLYIDGKIVQGMDTNHTQVKLQCKSGAKALLYGYTGMDISKRLNLTISIIAVDNRVQKLYYDLIVPFEMLAYSDKESKEYSDLLYTLNDALNLLDMRQRHSTDYYKGLDRAVDYIAENLYKKHGGSIAPRVNCVGHTHIDIAWLWTVAQTREKAVRSFATVLNLMKQYPDYKFFSSQPVLYQMVKEDAPELYQQIKQRIKEGRWEAEGSMWVEADCNLISGESFVRQILYGKRFFKKEFGVDNKILWLPDVFGYSAALPQILKKCGIDFFVTSKISWNDTNRIPYDTFSWKGIDGSEVLTYFITTQDKTRNPSINFTTYVGMATPAQVSGAYARYQQKELSDEVMLLYGHGDGGGGPTQEHLEYLARMDKGLPLCPTTVQNFAIEFLNTLKEGAGNHKRLPKWSGELYLEYHRGTYTSIAKNKRSNRKAEFLQTNAESLAVADMILFGTKYPKDIIEQNWYKILVNQFHDIIPGSSIKEVYDVTDNDYKEIFENGNAIVNGVRQRIATNIKTEGGILVFNPNSFTASGNVELDGQSIYVENIPPKGYRVVKDFDNKCTVHVGKNTLENEKIRLEFDAHYNIISIFDKTANRQVLQEGAVAGIRAYEDLPFNFDAWEISEYYTEKSWLIEDVLSVEKLESGNKAGFIIKRKFLDSELEQKVCLYSNQSQIEFDCCFNWKTEHILLKAEFPVEINATRAIYDIQYGAIDRPATKNDSWECAKFEVCAHKYADLSEYGYGVALLNDCKYGYAIHNSVISLSLLKCPTYPNKEADKDVHRFTYCLLPHQNDYREAGIIQQAYLLNCELKAYKLPKQNGTLSESYSLVESSAKNVFIEAIKQSEDGDNLIVRCWEGFNKKSLTRLDFGFKATSVFICNMLEQKERQLTIQNNSVELELKPYEIVTLLIERG